MTFDVERVKEVAAAQLEFDPGGGAALSVFVDGQPVLDETWGVADRERGSVYVGSTLQIIQSMGKGVVGAVAAMLVSRGQLDVDAPVASYWPEFAQSGKGEITVAQLLSHQAGLAYLDGGMPLATTTNSASDREELSHRLAAQAPAWRAGAHLGYSPQVSGNYADFVFEHASGRSFSELLTELTATVGLEMYVGLPEEQTSRAATVAITTDLESPVIMPGENPDLPNYSEIIQKLVHNIPETVEDPIGACNGAAIRRAHFPAANMFSDARSVAGLYAAMERVLAGEDSSLWSRKGLQIATTERVRSVDSLLAVESAFGVAFQKPGPTYPFAKGRTAFGHGGAGGSFSMADPDMGLALCWLPSGYCVDHFDRRGVAIVDAVYAALD
ncbi:serine hydrolase domain-containing protein [Brevibacterium sp. FAM 24638]|uniref:serine hydrolase domain-containing protein n=1 Tax=Brevibacterium sp. FAM 24638 TaxID=3415681 RepID=UPI003C7BACC0